MTRLSGRKREKEREREREREAPTWECVRVWFAWELLVQQACLLVHRVTATNFMREFSRLKGFKWASQRIRAMRGHTQHAHTHTHTHTHTHSHRVHVRIYCSY